MIKNNTNIRSQKEEIEEKINKNYEKMSAKIENP